MGAVTKIEWCHRTFNPWWGCTKVSPACDHCYAETWAKRCGLKVWGKDAERRFFGDKHFDEPLKWDRAAEKAGERHRVFCGSMCDVMESTNNLDSASAMACARQHTYSLIERTPHLDWLLLTKRPQNFERFLPQAWLNHPRPNVWLLTTVESNEFMWRVEALLEVRAILHGVSYEPALGPADFSEYLPNPKIRRTLDGRTLPSLAWVIAGGESGANARPPHPDWFRAVRDDCAAAGVPFLLKQWGEWTPKANFGGIAEWNKASAYTLVSACGGDKTIVVEGRDEPDPEFGLRCCDLDGNDEAAAMARIGKKAAGKLLDGREHLAYPEVRA
jgi:protein gp37